MGTLGSRYLFAAAPHVGVEWYIVEQDDPNDALVDIATGLRHLEGLAG